MQGECFPASLLQIVCMHDCTAAGLAALWLNTLVSS